MLWTFKGEWITSYIIPEELYYTPEHEWTRVDDEYVIVGISDYAQKTLHEIVYVEIPDIGTTIKYMEILSTVESIKAVSEVFSPVSGKIIEVNKRLEDSPELLNKDPYGEGWIAKIRPADLEADLKKLMTMNQYEEHLKSIS